MGFIREPIDELSFTLNTAAVLVFCGEGILISCFSEAAPLEEDLGAVIGSADEAS